MTLLNNSKKLILVTSTAFFGLIILFVSSILIYSSLLGYGYDESGVIADPPFDQWPQNSADYPENL